MLQCLSLSYEMFLFHNRVLDSLECYYCLYLPYAVMGRENLCHYIIFCQKTVNVLCSVCYCVFQCTFNTPGTFLWMFKILCVPGRASGSSIAGKFTAAKVLPVFISFTILSATSTPMAYCASSVDPPM